MRRLIGEYVRSYLAQVDDYRQSEDDDDFALHLDNTDGPDPRARWCGARLQRRADLLDGTTVLDDGVAHVRATTPRSASWPRPSGRRWSRAFERYLETIPDDKRFDRELFYDLRDVVGQVRVRHRQRRAAGVQPAGRGLQPGARQRRGAVDEAGQRPGREPVRRHRRRRRLLRERGPPHGRQPAGAAGAHRPAAGLHHASTASGTSCRRCRRTRWTWTGRASPSPTTSREVVDLLGRATAKIHCASDEDSEQDLVDFQVEEAIAGSLEGRRREFTGLADRLGDGLRRAGARGPRAVRRGLPRGARSGSPRPD